LPSLRSPYQNPACTSIFLIRATCPAHFILLNLITRITFGDEYRSLSSSLCSCFITTPIIQSLSWRYNRIRLYYIEKRKEKLYKAKSHADIYTVIETWSGIKIVKFLYERNGDLLTVVRLQNHKMNEN
jgi:hypothetical protein